MRVEISNWHDVVIQFGLEDRNDGILTAKEISNELTQRVTRNSETNVFIHCNKNSEAEACFSLDSCSYGENFYYSYLGTVS